MRTRLVGVAVGVLAAWAALVPPAQAAGVAVLVSNGGTHTYTSLGVPSTDLIVTHSRTGIAFSEAVAILPVSLDPTRPACVGEGGYADCVTGPVAIHTGPGADRVHVSVSGIGVQVSTGAGDDTISVPAGSFVDCGLGDDTLEGSFGVSFVNCEHQH